MASTDDDVSPDPAQLLELSGERDQWHQLALQMWCEGYALGHADGHSGGYRQGYEQAVRQWKITAAGLTHLGGPTWKELDKRRYPPDGRLSWIKDAASQEGAA